MTPVPFESFYHVEGVEGTLEGFRQAFGGACSGYVEVFVAGSWRVFAIAFESLLGVNKPTVGPLKALLGLMIVLQGLTSSLQGPHRVS